MASFASMETAWTKMSFTYFQFHLVTLVYISPSWLYHFAWLLRTTYKITQFLCECPFIHIYEWSQQKFLFETGHWIICIFYATNYATNCIMVVVVLIIMPLQGQVRLVLTDQAFSCLIHFYKRLYCFWKRLETAKIFSKQLKNRFLNFYSHSLFYDCM